MIKQPKNLQERIFAHVRELGMSVGMKCDLVHGMYGKYHVCQLTREQGLELESFLTWCISEGQVPTTDNAVRFRNGEAATIKK